MTTCPVCGQKAAVVYGDGCERCLMLPEDDSDRLERIAWERADAAGDAWRDEGGG